MNKQICIISPKCTSKSAKWLASILDADYNNPYQTNKYGFMEYKQVVNFGYSGQVSHHAPINKSLSVAIAVDKLATFKSIDSYCSCVPYTTKKEIALDWLDEDFHVVCREQQKGNKSKGITITDKKEEVEAIKAKFYTQYIEHKKEYRVNVFKGKVITVLEKSRGDDGNFKFKLVRNSPYTFKSFIKAIDKHIGLDLYGMDILLGTNNRLYFLEVNSGPHLFGQTAVQMASTLKKELGVK